MLKQGKFALSTLAAMLALAASPNAHAGLFDFLSDGDAKKPDQKQETPAKETPANGKATKTASAGNNDKCSGDPAQEIFKTKTMSAAELMAELRGLKGGFTTGDPVQSLNAMFFGPSAARKGAASAPQSQKAKSPAPSAKKPAATAKASDECKSLLSTENLGALNALASGAGGSMFSDVASSVTDMLLDALISQLSYSAIEAFLTQMLDRPDVMSQITVEVPEVSSLSPELRKQTLNLGGYLAAIKGSNLMIESAQKEFDAAKDSYKKVMSLREKAATTLKEALLAKQELKAALVTQKAKGISAISDGDLQYVNELLDKSPNDFFRDGKVQQVAIAYLKSQPDRKGDLAEMDGAQAEFKGHYGAYGRTAAGAGSMVGFSSMFLKKTKNLWEKQGLAGGAVLVPMITQGAKEVGSLAINVKKVFEASDDMNEGSFLIEKSGTTDKRGISFQKAVGRMDEGALAALKANLIREDRSGDISLLYLHAKDSATNLADRVVSKDDKKKLADVYGLDNPELFTFENALADKTKLDGKNKKRIGQAFQISATAGKGDEEGSAIEAVQKQLRDNFGKYTNGDARRIMFARAASTGNDWIAAGDYKIRIDNIGMEGLNDQMDFLIAESRHATTRALEKGGSDARFAKGRK